MKKWLLKIFTWLAPHDLVDYFFDFLKDLSKNSETDVDDFIVERLRDFVHKCIDGSSLTSEAFSLVLAILKMLSERTDNKIDDQAVALIEHMLKGE